MATRRRIAQEPLQEAPALDQPDAVEEESDGTTDLNPTVDGEPDLPDGPQEPEFMYNFSKLAMIVRRTWLTKDFEELETEVRGWSSVDRLPEDHGFSREELAGYLALLNACAAANLPAVVVPSYRIIRSQTWKDQVVPKLTTQLSLAEE